MEAVGFYQTLVLVWNDTRRHISIDIHLLKISAFFKLLGLVSAQAEVNKAANPGSESDDDLKEFTSLLLPLDSVQVCHFNPLAL